MSVNSSSFSVLHHDPPNSSLLFQMSLCYRASISIAMFSVYTVTFILLLPVFLLVFYLGYRQWRTSRSAPTTTASFNPDVFTYHSVSMQLSEFLGLTLHFCGGYNANVAVKEAGLFLWLFTSIGQTLFHLLSCLEVYLAVVHPITYLGLKKPSGVRIRNITIACVWFLSFGWLAVIYNLSPEVHFVMHISLLAVFIIVVSFCSFFILCALRRPGPGDGLNRQQADPAKQRAFHTIMAIFGLLMLRFCSNLTNNVIHWAGVLSPRYVCLAFLSAFWLDLPSNLILPLLFLRRAGKLH